MVSPINYILDVRNPIDEMMKGYASGRADIALGQQMQEREQMMGLRQSQERRAQATFEEQQRARAEARAAAARQRQQAEAGRAALLEYFDKQTARTATPNDLRRAIIQFPGMSQQFQAVANSFTEERLGNEQKFGKQLSFALSKGQTDTARALLQERADAAEASGDERSAAAYNAQLIELDANPEGLLMQTLMPLAATLETDDFDKFYTQILGQGGVEQTEAFRTTDAQLRAAGIVPREEGGDGRYEEAMAGKAGLGEAAPEAVSPIGKIAQDVDAGIIPKSVLDTAIRIEEKQGAEGLTLQQKIAEEARLRGEYVKRTEDLTAASRNYDLIETSAADDSGAGDIALVTSFMKMLDPGSVVRETEFATARDTSGLMGRLKAAATKIEDGRFLSPEQRQDFVRLSKQYLDAAKRQQDGVRASFAQIIDNYQLNPVNVFGVEAVTTAQEQPAAGAIPQSFLTNPAVISNAEKYGVTPEAMWNAMKPEQRSAYE